MALLLVDATPPPAGALTAYRALDGDDLAAGPVNLDVDDLVVAATLATVAGTPVAGATATLLDDEVTIAVWPPVDLPAGTYVVAVTAASVALALEADDGGLVDVEGHRYAATIAGVEAFVPNLGLTYASTPSAADVAGWLDEVGARVASRLTRLPALTAHDPTGAALIVERARGLVHLGAAAFTEDAAHPERITAQGDARYGAALWARFTEGLDGLESDLVAALEVDGVAGVDHAAASFPPALIRRDTGI